MQCQRHISSYDIVLLKENDKKMSVCVQYECDFIWGGISIHSFDAFRCCPMGYILLIF